MMRARWTFVLCASAALASYLATVDAWTPESVTFTDVTNESRITFSHVWSSDKKYILESMSGGVAILDFDKDGWPDVYFVNSPTVATAADPGSARSELWRNRGDGTFVDVTEKAGVGYPGWGMGAVVADFDNDGWLDLLVVNGHVYPQVERAGLAARYAQRKLLYRNNQNGTFTETTSTAGPALSEPSVSRGSATADLDNDGDLDVVINNLDGPPTVLRNDAGNRRSFLAVDLEGRTGNRSAIGAIVTVSAADLVQRAERRSGDSYLSHSDARLHFGLGTRTKVDSIEVRWPNGTVQRFGEAPANRFIRIVEGASALQTIVSTVSRHQ
jgi:enediyne biosynthesis protein E4